MSARTLKSEMYWPRIELPSWLLLPAKGTELERSVRSGQLREAERLRQVGCDGERSVGRKRLSGPAGTTLDCGALLVALSHGCQGMLPLLGVGTS